MRKKKDPNEMDDRELLRQVFPERVIRRVEEELEPLRKPATEPDSDDDSPNNQSL